MNRRLSAATTSIGDLSGPHTATTKLVIGIFPFVNTGTADLTGQVFSALDSSCDGTGFGNAIGFARVAVGR